VLDKAYDRDQEMWCVHPSLCTLLTTKMSLSREEYMERFAEYDAQFNQMEERVETL
jgi:hypothetical protein